MEAGSDKPLDQIPLAPEALPLKQRLQDTAKGSRLCRAAMAASCAKVCGIGQGRVLIQPEAGAITTLMRPIGTVFSHVLGACAASI